MEKKKINQSEPEHYITSGGVRCVNPDCRSDNIEGDFIETDAGQARQRITCKECEWSWVDVYTLTSITDIEDEEGKRIVIGKGGA